MWAAPAVTTLGGAAFAAGSCVRDQTLFEFITGNLTSPAKQPSANVAGPFVAGGTLALTSGQVDLVGAGTDFTAAQFPTETSIDLTGTYPAGTAGPVVSVLTAQGLALPAGAYIVELDTTDRCRERTSGTASSSRSVPRRSSTPERFSRSEASTRQADPWARQMGRSP